MVLKTSPQALSIIVIIIVKGCEWFSLAIDKGFQRTNLCLIWILYAKVKRVQSFIGRWSQTNIGSLYLCGGHSYNPYVLNVQVCRVLVLNGLLVQYHQSYYLVFWPQRLAALQAKTETSTRSFGGNKLVMNPTFFLFLFLCKYFCISWWHEKVEMVISLSSIASGVLCFLNPFWNKQRYGNVSYVLDSVSERVICQVKEAIILINIEIHVEL